MSATPTETCFVFIIQTDLYAGNFERAMCAYLTGVVGDCTVGEEEAKLYEAETDRDSDEWDDLILSIPDEHGCCRPVSIWGNRVKDVAIFFQERPSFEQCAFLRERAKKFAASQEWKDRQPCIKGFELIHYQVEVTEQQVNSWKIQ